MDKRTGNTVYPFNVKGRGRKHHDLYFRASGGGSCRSST
jgi:hypothetical protein